MPGRRRDPKGDLDLYLTSLGFEREVRFHDSRRWRFDWAKDGVAVEYEGGVFASGDEGGHRAMGRFLADVEKYSVAAAMGWKVIRCTAKHVESGDAFSWIEQALGGAG